MEYAASYSRHLTPGLVVLTAVLVVPLLYFASVGPVYWLCEHDCIHPDLIVVYLPMFWLAEHVHFLNVALSAYIGLWQW